VSDDSADFSSKHPIGVTRTSLDDKLVRDAYKLANERRIELSFLRSEIALLREALERITQDGCGCSPVCRCDSKEALAIWKEEVQTLARDALLRAKGGES